MEPFISDVSSLGLVEFGFPSSIDAETNDLTTDSAVPVRLLASRFYDEDSDKVYEKIETISI